MSKTTATVKKLVIPTYPEAAAEKLPMFAENRVHQRFSGNPYPNAVVIKTPGKEKFDKTYEAITLENDYLELTILPELGGRIFTAVDKTTGYDFFYRQHVIKPALIGALGSWISGGVEFNWPYHHRPSTFMPVDYEIVTEEDGVTVWLSEHDPIDRMKGMVGIYLADERSIFETRMKVSNRTPMRRPFLWWENTAVPVNPDYEIFFPADVDNVCFHYRRSYTSFPIARGHFNGFTFDPAGVDIRKHFNTKFSTSYFCAASDYDYFGGYDNGKKCGVVHIGDHHVATGKKMFTWAYNQLSRSWERALTDTDGAYAELMAGSYTNNQPDCAWLEPYETKCFKQSWFPIGALGVPTFANFDAAVHVESGALRIQATAAKKDVRVTLVSGGKTVFSTVCDLVPGKVLAFDIPAFDDNAYTITLGDFLHYEQVVREQKPLPPLFCEVPYPNEINTAEKAYLAGLHLVQYRDPSADPAEYFKRAIELEPTFTPALRALGEICLNRHEYQKAKELLARAAAELNTYNINHESGKTNYLLGLALTGLGEDKAAYDAFRRAAWNEDAVSAAMTRAAMLDGKRGDFAAAKYCADTAIEHNAQNLTAIALSAAASYKLGDKAAAARALKAELVRDPLNHLARYFLVVIGESTMAQFFEKLHSNMSQTCLDLAGDLQDAGYAKEAGALLSALPEYTGDVAPAIALLLGDKSKASPFHRTFPSRPAEAKILEANGEKYLLGCYHYADRRYAEAERLWRDCDSFEAKRALALCEYRKGNLEEAMALLDEAHTLCPDMEEIVYEIAYLLNHTGADPKAAAERIKSMVPDLKTVRDDIATEWACACNRAGQYDDALAVLSGHSFVPCEGGETAVAMQYINAWYGKGMNLKATGKYEEAIEAFRTAQVLPENLGAGLWHECPLVPAKYQEALLLEKLGRTGEAFELYNYFNTLYVDFFSNMHLPMLPVYQALGDIRMGKKEEAAALLDRTLAGWRREMTRRNSGYFGTTPFFIPFMDDPVRMREQYYRPLIQEAEAVQNGSSALLTF